MSFSKREKNYKKHSYSDTSEGIWGAREQWRRKIRKVIRFSDLS